MSYRSTYLSDLFASKTPRNERFEQMTKQELLICEKKRQIEAKFEARKRKEIDETVQKFKNSMKTLNSNNNNLLQADKTQAKNNSIERQHNIDQNHNNKENNRNVNSSPSERELTMNLKKESFSRLDNLEIIDCKNNLPEHNTKNEPSYSKSIFYSQKENDEIPNRCSFFNQLDALKKTKITNEKNQSEIHEKTENTFPNNNNKSYLNFNTLQDSYVSYSSLSNCNSYQQQQQQQQQQPMTQVNFSVTVNTNTTTCRDSFGKQTNCSGPLVNVNMSIPLVVGAKPEHERDNMMSSMCANPEEDIRIHLAHIVAQCGDGIEEIVYLKNQNDPSLAFLKDKFSEEYKIYRKFVQQFLEENQNQNLKRKRSRWGPETSNNNNINNIERSSNSDLIQYEIQRHGGRSDLCDMQWKKVKDNYKLNNLYLDILKKRHELEQVKLKYDSDEEENENGTWDHQLRAQEMEATRLWTEELNRLAQGKHHIGDFLPPEELEHFLEKYQALKEDRSPDLSDYKEFKLREDNIGFQMLQKLGWKQGQGLGRGENGILYPVNTKGGSSSCLKNEPEFDLSRNDDEYDAYRKRMMLAYRFRPNPLNNPRRSYY